MSAFQPGNPGRPKGCRNKKNREIEAVIQHLVDYVGQPKRMDAMLAKVCEEKPEVVLNILARLAPKTLDVNTTRGEVVIYELPAERPLEEDREQVVIDIPPENPL